jgi:hypothetical protein
MDHHECKNEGSVACIRNKGSNIFLPCASCPIKTTEYYTLKRLVIPIAVVDTEEDE